MCCVFDPAEYRDGPGLQEERLAASADASAEEAEPEVDEASAEEEAHSCC